MNEKIYLVLQIEEGTGKVIGSIRAFKNLIDAERVKDKLNDYTMYFYHRCDYIVEKHDLQSWEL